MKSILSDLANPEAERSILGSIVIDPGALAELIGRLEPGDFFVRSNGLIFQAMIDLFHEQIPIDLVTLDAALDGQQVGDGQLKGISYLTRLTIETATSAHIHDYVDIVREMAERRRLVLAGEKVAKLAVNRKLEIQAVREQAHQEIIDCMTGEQLETRPAKQAAGHWLTQVEERMSNPDLAHGLLTGYFDLDRLTRGLRANRLYVFGGRPGMGKTALLLGMAHYMAVQLGEPGVFFSLEMSGDELLTRLIAGRTKINSQRIEAGELDDDELGLFYRAVGELSDAPLWIDDSPGLSILEMRARATRAQALSGGRLSWIMVDFLQLARAPGLEPGYQETSQVARGLKDMAMALRVPVIAASQLNRSTESRLDKRPQLVDLRESGQIEEAADVVGLLYREDYYNALGPANNLGEVNLAKHRGGPTGIFELYWRAETASYLNLRKESINV